MNKAITFIQIHSRSDYGTKIKEDYPKCYTDPRSSRLGSTTDQLERNNTKDKIFIELLLSLVASPARFNDTCNLVFGSICESRGLSNLTPARSRLFKLVGQEVQRGGATAAKHIWWLTCANESEKRSKGTDVI